MAHTLEHRQSGYNDWKLFVGDSKLKRAEAEMCEHIKQSALDMDIEDDWQRFEDDGKGFEANYTDAWYCRRCAFTSSEGRGVRWRDLKRHMLETYVSFANFNIAELTRSLQTPIALALCVRYRLFLTPISSAIFEVASALQKGSPASLTRRT